MLNFRILDRSSAVNVSSHPPADVKEPSDEERRLARELQSVLGKSFDDPVNLTATEHLQYAYDPDVGEAFEWVDADTADEDDAQIEVAQSASSRSDAWLRRAQSEKRWADTSHAMQRLILCIGVGAFLILTIWPGLS